MGRRCELLAVDLDGTLLDSAGELPDGHRSALHRAHEAGVRVCLTTGRCFTETRPVIERIGLDLDVAVTAFGAVVSDAASGRTLFAEAMAPATVDHLCGYFRERDYSVLLLHDAEMTGWDYSVLRGEHWDEGIDRWFRKVGCRIRWIEDWRALREPVLRVSLSEPPARAERLMEEIAAKLPGELFKANWVYVAPMGSWLLEFFAPPVNKWYGLERLCVRLGIEAGAVAAIGDGVNDLEMLRGAGISYAMGNAEERVRAAAQRVTASNDEGGVARAIEEILAERAAR